MEAAEAIRRYFNGVNQEDWDDFRGIWHDDAVIEVVGGIRVQGWGEILPYYTGALAGFPVHHDDPYKVHVAGDTITVEIAFTGETVDGVPATFEAVDVFTMEDGLVRRLTTWYDLGRVLGFLRTPGPPPRRLRTLVRRAASSPYYRSRLEELSLSADAVADDLTQLPPTRLEGVGADQFVAASEKQLTHVVQRSDGAWPLTRDDVAERGRLWATALRLAGVGRGEVVAAAEPSPGLAEGVAAVRARLAFAVDPAAVGATVVVESLGAVELPETGVVASPCTKGGLHAHAESHIVEIVDGELVVTPLGASAAPLLRFATGIRGGWADGPCGCGSDLPVLVLEGVAEA